MLSYTSYFFAGAVITLGASVQRPVGERAAVSTITGILFMVTIFLLLALIRFKEVQIIPDTHVPQKNAISCGWCRTTDTPSRRMTFSPVTRWARQAG
jgi:hypothetical protein